MGYQTLRMPGDIEYAVQRPPFDRGWEPQFGDGLGVWATFFDVDSGGALEGSAGVEISAESSKGELESLAKKLNLQRQRKKSELLADAERSGKDERPKTAALYAREAEAVRLLEPFKDGLVYASVSIGVDLHALVDKRIVSVGRSLVGSPEQTIDTFLHNYRPRAPFHVPAEIGACLPYAFMSAEVHQATTGISLRLTDRPDIVIYLHDQPVDKAQVDAREVVNKAVQRGYFYGAKYTEPLDGNLRPFRSIKIDGREGLGGFALITRNPAQQSNIQIANTVNKDQDWGYLAYIPGDKNAPPGMSSDLIFKVERFGRFAKQPMTESEFRELVKTLASGIKRRPGAWAPR